MVLWSGLIALCFFNDPSLNTNLIQVGKTIKSPLSKHSPHQGLSKADKIVWTNRYQVWSSAEDDGNFFDVLVGLDFVDQFAEITEIFRHKFECKGVWLAEYLHGQFSSWVIKCLICTYKYNC